MHISETPYFTKDSFPWQERLSDLTREQCARYAHICSILVLPLIGYAGNLDYLDKLNNQEKLYDVFNSIDLTHAIQNKNTFYHESDSIVNFFKVFKAFRTLKGLNRSKTILDYIIAESSKAKDTNVTSNVAISDDNINVESTTLRRFLSLVYLYVCAAVHYAIYATEHELTTSYDIDFIDCTSYALNSALAALQWFLIYLSDLKHPCG